MIDLSVANQLLNFGASIGDGVRANEQLAGAVAIHNILERHSVAYLADEVGMGKTYVALGAMALFRHFNPEFRVLVIAPRENIQQKWIKELSNFCAKNVRYPDLRMMSVGGGPARSVVGCENLHSFVHEVSVDSRRDFFLRLTSFSFGLGADAENWKKQRNQLRRELPWLADEVFDLRNKQTFKDNYARAVCCALPVFDLVIVDEAHNLKHGFKDDVAARNRVLGLALGRSVEMPDPRLYPGYGRKAKRVLFLSATPIEASYVQLWNQLDVFGLGGAFTDLKRKEASEEERKQTVRKFLVRRVTSIQANGNELTKNQYRQEWRKGGVLRHDEPIQIADPRKRLVVALVQKKVAELLGSEKFNNSFQIGMLASFESFLQTAKLRREEENGNFDDNEQKRDLSDVEKEGLDVRDINLMARDFHRQFGEHMPHPKMDEVVDSLAQAWLTGKKTLVFVRRVASVKELKQKLDEKYDKWLIPFLRNNIPDGLRVRFDLIVGSYRKEKFEAEETRQARDMRPANGSLLTEAEVVDDHGGIDTFFAWFFRGDGPARVISGANIQKRFRQAGSAYSTFFERNHVAEILEVNVGAVVNKLIELLGFTKSEMALQVQRRAAKYLSGRAKKHPRRDQFVAAQAAVLEMLMEHDVQRWAIARTIFQQVYQGEMKHVPAKEAPDVMEWLEEATFFTELRRTEWATLRDELWPRPARGETIAGFRESELRAQLLSTTARLGHGLIDLYLLIIGRLNSFDLRTLDTESDDEGQGQVQRITQYLGKLDEQRVKPLVDRTWTGFDELREVSSNFSLILDVNAPKARTVDLIEAARMFGTLLGGQQPVGGMSGQVNRTLVQQFRMPGYPFVLVTTDLLQEGEDLHTFCSSIYHYGISWTPSSMEQRIGRIDRVRSQTDRRLSSIQTKPIGEDLLQVHFPYLQDTVEILQVERVIERMNVFLRLMHEGLVSNFNDGKHIDIEKTLAKGRRPIEVITEKLVTAFPIVAGLTSGEIMAVAVPPSAATDATKRLDAIRAKVGGALDIEWFQTDEVGQLMGTIKLKGGRIQPFVLLIDSLEGRFLIRCISPIGVVDDLVSRRAVIEDSVKLHHIRLGALLDREPGSYNLTVQEDVVLGDQAFDGDRVESMLRRIGEQADRLETIHLPGHDRPIRAFVDKLRTEGLGTHD